MTAGHGSSYWGRRANEEAVSSGHTPLCRAGCGGADGPGHSRGERGSAFSAGEQSAQVQGAESTAAT